MEARGQVSGRQASDVRGRPPLARLALAFALGSAAGLSALVVDVPGRGEFFALTWLAGFIAMILAPGAAGLVAVVVGAAGSAAIVDVAGGTFGLVLVIVAAVAALASHGALVGAVLRRCGTLGIKGSVGDAKVMLGAAVAVGIMLLFVWLALELGAGPP